VKININILSEVRLRRPKITCAPSYADDTPKTILLDMSHTVWRDHTWEQ
jgi:hypothetical protein